MADGLSFIDVGPVSEQSSAVEISSGNSSIKKKKSPMAVWKMLKRNQLGNYNEYKFSSLEKAGSADRQRLSAFKFSLQKSDSLPANSESLQERDLALEPTDPEVRRALSIAEANSNFSGLVTLARSKDSSLEQIRTILAAIRALTKPRAASVHRVRMIENRGVEFLLSLLSSPDAETVEHSLGILMNLSLEEYIKDEVFSTWTVDCLVEVIKYSKKDVTQEYAAATLGLLTDTGDRQEEAGKSEGLIPALLDLLSTGTLQGRKDAALVLLNLSSSSTNRKQIIENGGVKGILEIFREGKHRALQEKVIFVLDRLCKEQEGKIEMISSEGGVPALVELLQSSSDYCKTEAASILLYLAESDPRFEILIEKAGGLLTLRHLTRSGTERLQKKATLLYERLAKRKELSETNGSSMHAEMEE